MAETTRKDSCIKLSEIEVIILKNDYDENEDEGVQRKKEIPIFDQTMSLVKFYKSLLQMIKDKKV